MNTSLRKTQSQCTLPNPCISSYKSSMSPFHVLRQTRASMVLSETTYTTSLSGFIKKIFHEQFKERSIQNSLVLQLHHFLNEEGR